MSTLGYPIEDQKKEIESSFARILLMQIEKNGIPFEVAQEVAQLYLSEIDQIQTQEELLSLLQRITEKSAVFDSILQLYKLKVGAKQEAEQKLQIAEKTLSEIKSS